MTTLMVVDGNRGESRSKAAARRLREELAGQRISISEVARRIGTTQQKLSRRMTGSTPWDVDELDEVCQASGVSFDYVTTGIRAIPNPDGGPGGGISRPESTSDKSSLFDSKGRDSNPATQITEIRRRRARIVA